MSDLVLITVVNDHERARFLQFEEIVVFVLDRRSRGSCLTSEIGTLFF